MATRKGNGLNEVVPRKLIFTKSVLEATFVRTLPTDTHRTHIVHVYEYTLEEILHPNGMPIKLGMKLPLRNEGLEWLIQKGTVKPEF